MNRFLLLFISFLLLTGAAYYNSGDFKLLKYNKKFIALSSASAVSTVPGVSVVTKFGINYDIDAAEGYELIGAQGGAIVIPTTTETLSVVSDSANDDDGNTGATQIFIEGVDSSGGYTFDFITMDGLTPALTANSYKFVNRATVYTTGSNNTNVGNITITNSTSAQTLAYIPADYGVTQQLAYYVINGKQCYIDRMRFHGTKQSGGSTPYLDFHVHVYSSTQDTEYIIRDVDMNTGIENSLIWEKGFKSQPLLQNEIFWIEADTDTNNTRVSGEFALVCQDI